MYLFKFDQIGTEISTLKIIENFEQKFWFDINDVEIFLKIKTKDIYSKKIFKLKDCKTKEIINFEGIDYETFCALIFVYSGFERLSIFEEVFDLVINNPQSLILKEVKLQEKEEISPKDFKNKICDIIDDNFKYLTEENQVLREKLEKTLDELNFLKNKFEFKSDKIRKEGVGVLKEYLFNIKISDPNPKDLNFDFTKKE
jgi:predicted nuclease with TOPRIM domain